MAARSGSRFILHTTAGDLDRIRASGALAALEAVIEPDIRLIADMNAPAHTIQALCHSEAMHEADKASAPLLFISPDTIWSDGAVRRLLEILEDGKRVVFVTNLRATKEDALPVLLDISGRQPAGRLSLSGREITRIALDHLHASIEENFFEAGRGEKLLPCNLIWQTPNGELLVRSFHAHPVMVFPRRRFARFHRTIDGDLVSCACPNARDYHVVTDSDELTCVELSRRSHFIGGVCEKGDVRASLDWALGNTNAVHWRLLDHAVRLHAGPVVAADWEATERRADEIVAEIHRMRRWRRPASLARRVLIAATCRITGLAPWQVNEGLFRLHWRVNFWWGETYLRKLKPVLDDPWGRAIVLGYRVASRLARPVLRRLGLRPSNLSTGELEEKIFRLLWGVRHAALSLYRRRIRAAFLFAFRSRPLEPLDRAPDEAV